MIKPLPDIMLVVRHLSWKRKNSLKQMPGILSHLIKFRYKKFFQKLLYLSKTTLFKISPIGTPLDFALELKSGLDECPEYVLVSIPAWPETSKIHLETDCLVNALYGFMKLNNSWYSSWRKSLVLSIHISIWLQTQRLPFSWKCINLIGFQGLP